MKSRLLGVVLYLLAINVNASVVYNYQGNGFDVFSFDYPSGSDGISGSMTLPTELAENLDWVTVSPTSWSFTDGLTTASNLTSGHTGSFQFSTNALGQIIDWRVLLSRPLGILDVATFEVRTRTDSPTSISIFDEATYCVELTTSGTCADGTNAYAGSPGSWSVVPVPAAFWLFGTGLIGLVGVARRNE